MCSFNTNNISNDGKLAMITDTLKYWISIAKVFVLYEVFINYLS